MLGDETTNPLRALRGIGSLFVARALVGISTLVVFAVLARILTETDFGLFALAFSVSYLVAAVLDGGHGLLVVRELAQRPHEAGRYLGALVFLRLVVGGPLLVIALGGAVALGDSPPAVFLVSALAAHLQVFAGLPREFLIARDRVMLAAAHSIGETILRSTAVLAAAVVTGSVLGAFAAAALAHALWGAAGLLLLGRRMDLTGLAAGAREWRHMLQLSVPFGAFVVLTAAYSQLDVLVISLVMPLAAVGVFQAAVRVLAATDYLSEAAWRWAYPRFSRSAVAGPSRLSGQITTLSGALVLAGMGIGTLLIVGAPQFLPALYGPGLAGAVLPMQVMALAIPLRFAAHAFGAGLSASGVQRRRTQILMYVTGISGAMQLLMVSAFGLIGAAAGMVMSAGLLVGWYVVTARRFPHLRLGLGPVVLAALFAVAGAGAIAVIPHL